MKLYHWLKRYGDVIWGVSKGVDFDFGRVSTSRAVTNGAMSSNWVLYSHINKVQAVTTSKYNLEDYCSPSYSLGFNKPISPLELLIKVFHPSETNYI